MGKEETGQGQGEEDESGKEERLHRKRLGRHEEDDYKARKRTEEAEGQRRKMRM